MKKLIIVLILITLFACNKEGEIHGRSARNIKINGKEYYFMKVVPEDGERAVWLLIPADASVDIPEPISYTVSCGKNCHYVLTSIWVKS